MNINEECLTHAILEGKAIFNNVYIAGSDFNIENYIDKYSKNLNSIKKKIESVLFGAQAQNGNHIRRNSLNGRNSKKNNSVDMRKLNLSPQKKYNNNPNKLILSTAINFKSPKKNNLDTEFTKKIQGNFILEDAKKEKLMDSPNKKILLSLQISPLMNGYGLYGKKVNDKIIVNTEKNPAKCKKDRISNSIINVNEILKSIKVNGNNNVTEKRVENTNDKNKNKERNNKDNKILPKILNKELDRKNTILNFLENKKSLSITEKYHNEEISDKVANEENNNNTSFNNDNPNMNKECSKGKNDISKMKRTGSLYSNISRANSIENLDISRSEKKEELNLNSYSSNIPIKTKINFTNSTKFNFNQNVESPTNTISKNFGMNVTNKSISNSNKQINESSQGGNRFSMSINQEPNLMNFSPKANINIPPNRMKSLQLDCVSPLKNTLNIMSLKNQNSVVNTNLLNINESDNTRTNNNFANTNQFNSGINTKSEQNEYFHDLVNNSTTSIFNSTIFKSKESTRNLNIKPIKIPGLADSTPNMNSERKTEQNANKLNNSKLKSPLNIQYDSTLNFFNSNNIINSKNQIPSTYQTEVPDHVANLNENFSYMFSTMNMESIKTKPVDFVKEAFPQLIDNILSLQKESKGIRKEMKKTVEKGNKELAKSPLKLNNQKYVKENFDFELNLNDVFLYGANGEGYYMNNEKVFKEGKILKKIPSENILKHKKFFSQRFELKKPKKPEYPSGADDGLSLLAVQNFKKVSEFLDETENLKKKSINDIRKFKLRVLHKIDEV